MATLTYNGESFTVDHAAKGADYIHGYDADGVLVVAFDGVTDFSGFTYTGSYMPPSDCLAEVCNDVKFCGGSLKTRGGEDIYTESAEYPGCYYRTVDGVEEWVNPPMVLGEEYRTTERYKGKPVYAKLVYLDTLPNTTSKTVTHGIANIEDIIEARGSARTTDGSVVFLPSSSGSLETSWNIGVTQTSIFVATNRDRTNYRGSVLIKVIKTTD